MSRGARKSVALNTRALNLPLTGVQRYVEEIISHAEGPIAGMRPPRAVMGAAGHAWEQGILPLLVQGRTLFSPSNTGPLAVRRQVVTVHDVVPLDHPEWLNPKFARWYRWLLPKLVRRVAWVIAISEFTRERLIAKTHVAPGRVIVIRHGVNRGFAPQSRPVIEAAVRRLGLPSGRYFFCLGSLEPRKNLGTLLQAWAAAQKEMDEDVWLVVGGERGAGRVFAPLHLPPSPPRTFWAGRIPDDALAAVYSGALAFVYPSLYEGFGAPPLEALACGTPAIVGGRSAMPEVVGEAGILVDPVRPDDLSQALLDLARDSALRERLVSAGLKRAAQFSWPEAARKTWEILLSV